MTRDRPTREARSYCRLCSGRCGMRLTLGPAGEIVTIKGDHEHELTRGYACFKGLQAAALQASPQRILKPLKRQPGGEFSEIRLEQALDEIAEKLGRLIAAGGADSSAVFRGTANFFNTSAMHMVDSWMQALGSQALYSTLTIDQSAKMVAVERIGSWGAGKHNILDSEVCLLFGCNPLVSLHPYHVVAQDPARTLKMLRSRGLKLIVVDPRRSETAHMADHFLQPLPGFDAEIAAALLHVVLRENWQDEPFCNRFVNGLAALKAAVQPFTPERAADLAGIQASEIETIAAAFARDARRGCAGTGTGPDMAPNSNLAEHLIECLNVICGRFNREGELIRHPGIMGGVRERIAQVNPPLRRFEAGPRSRGGRGMLFGERLSGELADEILRQGKGQVTSLIVSGGNPVSALPDLRKAVRAFSSLKLLVAIEPFMTTTAQLSHYIIPPLLQYEHPDMLSVANETLITAEPFTQYSPAIVPPPAGSELAEDWYPFWGLARRLGLRLAYDTVPISMDAAPSTDDLLAILARKAPFSFDAIKGFAGGKRLQASPLYAKPAHNTGRFEVMPRDVASELAALDRQRMQSSDNGAFPLRLAVRRMRDVVNSSLHHVAPIHQRTKYNPLFVNPADLEAFGLADGVEVEITSAHGCTRGIAKADASLRQGVVSMSHAWGGLSGLPTNTEPGWSTNLLVSAEQVEAVNAMPIFSALPVHVRALAAISPKDLRV